MTAYSASKAAVRNLALTWAKDLKGTGIRVYQFRLGFILPREAGFPWRVQNQFGNGIIAPTRGQKRRSENRGATRPYPRACRAGHWADSFRNNRDCKGRSLP